MTKSDILDWFSVNNASLDANRILFVLGVGIMVGAIIFATYRITYTGVNYNAKFNVGNVVMLLIASVMMLMISSNIAISLGMVGALSIVRFRTAVKDTQDTVYIFWSIVEGLCVGAQIYKLALISVIVIAVVLVAASFYYNTKKKYLIIVRGGQKVHTEEIVRIIESGYKKACLKAANYGTEHCELIVEVLAREEIDIKVIDALRQAADVLSVNWLLEMGEHIG
ncbi:MAG: DUF4956 domain-containing protein [Lachnospiraceae bacterium]|nr:DUF4956 domain-containing protein [Lachnospiraceae bacterium]